MGGWGGWEMEKELVGSPEAKHDRLYETLFLKK